MDPYIERPAIWPDFHDRLITCLCAALQPLLRPRFVALTQDRLYVVESDRPIWPDVAVVSTPSIERRFATGAAVLEPDSPAVFDLWREEIRQPLIHIVEPAVGNRIVTAIEVLSPDNKKSGDGRASYLQKRDEFWNAGTNLVEIDLLREGEPTVRISADKMNSLRPRHYLVAVTRRRPSRQEVYPISLERRLPRVAIPLTENDRDATVDLQTVFTRCWDEGPYPELLRYQSDPPGAIGTEDLAWCREVLQAAFAKPAG
jgi:hypothetical protein